MIYLVEQLLALNNIKFDKEELSFQIKSHPSFPSLHSITGVLDHFSIDNLTLDVPTINEVFDQLPNSFLAQVTIDNTKELILVEKKGDTVKAIISLKKKVVYSIPDFLEKFTGIIVAIEKTATVSATEINVSSTFNKILLGSLIVCVLGLVAFTNPRVTDVLFIVFSILGIFTSIAILKENLGIQSSLGDTFCSSANVKSDCNKVITSNGSRLFGAFKLSDSSIIYFSALTIASLYLIIDGDLSALFILSFLSVPVVIYSIYYQYYQAKTWCPLCLIIAGILTLQVILGVITISEIQQFNFSTKVTMTIVAAFLGTALLWNILALQIKKFVSLKQDKIDYFKFKRNYELFKTMLEKSPLISTQISNKNEIVFGNRNASAEIVLVTSPFCGHCKPVHHHIAEILKRHKSDVSITIRFSVNTENTDADLYKITTRLIEIYHTLGQEDCLIAMHDIYSDMNSADWFSIWGACEKPDFYAETLEAQNTWFTTNGINFTPEILVNGRSFPKEYQRQDLGFFIEDLAEECQEIIQVPVLI